MNGFKAEIRVELNLTPPRVGESRELVLRRCLDGSEAITLLVRALGRELGPNLKDQIVVFLREMKEYFEPDLPRNFQQALAEWHEEFGDPAA